MPAFAPRDSLKWFPQASHLYRFLSLFVCSRCWLIKQMCHVLQKCVCYLKPSVFNPWAHSLLSFAFQTLWRGALQMAHQVRFLLFMWVCEREGDILYCYGHSFLLLQNEITWIIIIIKKQSQKQLHISDTLLWHNKLAVLHLFLFVLARFMFFQLSHSHFSF